MSNTPDSNRPDQRPDQRPDERPDQRPDEQGPNCDRTDSQLPDDGLLRIIVVVDENVACPVDQALLHQAVTAAAADRGYSRGEIGIRLTDDSGIHQVNRDHLGHDYPTDVISFAYHADKPDLEGELVVSVDTAAQRAGEFGWPLAHELSLYTVHGVLHITGMDDHDPIDRAEMRAAEQRIMIQLGIDDIVHYGADQTGPSIVEGKA